MKKYFNFIFSFQIILLVTSLNYKNRSTASSAALLFFVICFLNKTILTQFYFFDIFYCLCSS
ncbi:hypothetical protein B1P86_10425 [Enterococcus faecium]|nr:hypothetical protein B1P86_10425 [Enterococcus faecium]